MKQLQSQLKAVAKALAGLTDKIEKISAQAGVAPAGKRAKAPKGGARKKAVQSKEGEGMKDTVLDLVFDEIRKSRNGATIAHLKSKTALESRQLSNALYKLSKKGKIKAKSRGVYIKA